MKLKAKLGTFKMMKGPSLIQALIEASGLPKKRISRELNGLIEKAGKKQQNLTMDELRDILVDYLQTVLIEAKDSTTYRTTSN